VRWRREAAGLLRSQYPEWRRAGVRRLAVPVLVIRGRDDVLSSADWGRRLAG